MRYRKLFYLLFMGFLLVQCEPDSLFPATTISKITGTWHCSENSQIFNSPKYDVNITKGVASDAMEISNFYGLGFAKSVQATVDAKDILIPEQTVDGNIISGGGTISGDYQEINLDYSVDDQSGQVDHVTAVLTR